MNYLSVVCCSIEPVDSLTAVLEVHVYTDSWIEVLVSGRLIKSYKSRSKVGDVE